MKYIYILMSALSLCACSVTPEQQQRRIIKATAKAESYGLPKKFTLNEDITLTNGGLIPKGNYFPVMKPQFASIVWYENIGGTFVANDRNIIPKVIWSISEDYPRYYVPEYRGIHTTMLTTEQLSHIRK